MLSTTFPFRIPPMWLSLSRLLPVAFALLTTVVGTREAAAGVSWHPDLAAARRASAVSQRPVLAIFTASWSSVSSTLDRTTLASDEAVALIAACFEPVCVDVDAHPETTRRLGIQRVPTACVLTAEEQPLSTFELPETPAEFVAAAARAAQEAATATAAARQQPRAAAPEIASSRHAITDLTAGGSSPLPDLSTTTPPQPRGSVAPGGQAITAVAAKVRKLSDFASDAAPPSPESAAIAASFRDTARDQHGPLASETATLAPEPNTTLADVAPFPTSPETSDGRGSAFAAQAATVSPPAAPPATGADAVAAQVTAPTAASAVPPAAPSQSLAEIAVRAPLSIEPATTAAEAAPSLAPKSPPWLAATAPPPAPPAAEPPALSPAPLPAPQAVAATAPSPALDPFAQRQAGAAPTPGPATSVQPAPQAATAGSTTALAEAAPSTKPEKPAASGSQAFLAALQKPFAVFAPKAKPAPARSGQESPAASRTTSQPESAPAESVAATAPAAAADQYGSMPVGLEGYCPVTLTEKGAWVEGRAQWGVRHRGRTYLFAGAEQQKAFLADPDRYAPALSGDDPVLAFDAGKSTPGQRRYGVTYQSRMYLFSSTETRDAFAANPQRYTAGALMAENRVPTAGSVVR